MEGNGNAMAVTTDILSSDPTLTPEDQTASATTQQQPTPQIAPTYNWKIVTEPFKSACGELDLGELMHDDMQRCKKYFDFLRPYPNLKNFLPTLWYEHVFPSSYPH